LSLTGRPPLNRSPCTSGCRRYLAARPRDGRADPRDGTAANQPGEGGAEAFHGTWATNLAYSAGQQWLVWNERSTQLRHIQREDPAYAGRELFTDNRIREYIQSALGELSTEDDRPELLTAQEGDEAEQITKMLNRLAGYAWEHEWDADTALLEMRRLVLDLGVAAIRCRWNPDEGTTAGHALLGPDGEPVQDHETLAMLAQGGTLPDGSLPKVKTVKHGRTNWDTYSAFQILNPPGVIHESKFPWECLMEPVLVDDIEDIYGVRVQEDTDIVSSIGLPSSMASQAEQRSQNRLRDHAWKYTYFDRPSRRHPDGRSIILAGSDMQMLDVRDELPYKLGDEPHTGIIYFHWWRLSDRFQSQSFVEPMKDPQRVINRRQTQKVEIVDRSMPKMVVRKGDWPGSTTGAPMEIVEIERTAQPPTIMQGAGPGSWMYQEIEALAESLAHASTLSPLRLGENPERVQTYGQLALLNDNEHGKRQTVIFEMRAGVAKLVELSMSDLVKYWPEEKQAMVEGEEDTFEMMTFRKSEIPPNWRCRVAKGSPLPRSQGAQVQKIDAIWKALVESGAVATNPPAYAAWYKDSLEAGAPQDLPAEAPSSQQQMAKLENTLMRHGEHVPPTYYDNLQIHLPAHREEQDKARAEGNADLGAMLENHIQAHRAFEMANQQANQLSAQSAQLGPPGAPPDMQQITQQVLEGHQQNQQADQQAQMQQQQADQQMQMHREKLQAQKQGPQGKPFGRP
jgi:hypothetical protein